MLHQSIVFNVLDLTYNVYTGLQYWSVIINLTFVLLLHEN